MKSTNRSVILVAKETKEINEFSQILSEQYNVIISTDENKILKLIQNKKNKVSTIIFDLEYKKIDIISFVAKIRIIPGFKRFPILLLVDDVSTEVEEKYLESGISDFLIKRFLGNSKLLLTRIKNLIRMAESAIALKELERDELTGLYTRQAFIRKAEAYLEQNSDKEIAIVGVDFENFKLTNSQYGEEKCDLFLKYIGNQLIEKMVTGFSGRFSGDQFVLIFEYSDDKQFEYINNFSKDILKDAPISHQNPKIGVYAPIDKKLPIVRCCDNAFLALKEIKGIYNQNIAFYQKKLQEQMLTEQKILESMEKALEEKQFVVYYQPKHESITGKVAGAEALVRWIHPEYGFMSPAEFIPLFERNGFISKLDGFVLEQVCKDINEWKEQGIPIVPISVNVSRRDYLEDGWIDRQIDLIDKYKIEHELIHMEVTESLYAEYMDLIIDQIRKVKNKGFAIEMDDFGAGYSSLGTLSSFPLDIIKLDISFVRHISTNEIVVENIIKLAHKLGYITVAEGTETEEQYKILRGLGCDLIQGYCFSKPLPKNDFKDYLIEKTVRINEDPQPVKVNENNNFIGNEYVLKAVLEIGESLPGGFFSYHADGNHEIISFNKEILKIYGVETGDEFRKFSKNSFDNMVHPDDLFYVNDLINQQKNKKNDIFYLEYRILCKDKSVKYIRNYGRYVNTEQYGDIYYVFIQDFTSEHENNLQVQKKNEIIQCLSLNYTAIYLVDFLDDNIIPYAINSQFDEEMNSSFYEDKSYEQIRNFYAKKYVSPSERDGFLKVTSVENISEEFEKHDSFNFTYHFIDENDEIFLVEMSVRKLKDENHKTRAVLAFRQISEGMIDAVAERNTFLVSMLDKKDEKTQIEILNSMTSIYSFVNLLSFKEKTIIRFDSHSHEVRKFPQGKECRSEMNQKVAERIIENQKESFLKFTDLNTLKKRMGKKKLISGEFLSEIMGWIRVQYIRVNDDEFDLVVYTIQDIEEEKNKEEQLIRMSITDELTKVYNRTAFEEDVRALKKKKITQDFVIMYIDVNGLKTLNDEAGHAAGDELIKGTASCLLRSFGSNGRVYRIGGDEFIVIFYAEEKELRRLLNDFDNSVVQWKGEMVDNLSLSYGYVTKREFMKTQLIELFEIADQRMYKNKKLYYKSIGIDTKEKIAAIDVIGSSYIKILKINLTEDKYTVIKIKEKNKDLLQSSEGVLSESLTYVVDKGYIHQDYIDEYRKKLAISYLRSKFNSKEDRLVFQYKRLYKDEFKTTVLEIIPTRHFTVENKELFLYVKIFE